MLGLSEVTNNQIWGIIINFLMAHSHWFHDPVRIADPCELTLVRFALTQQCVANDILNEIQGGIINL